MFLRSNRRIKDGKPHRYYTVVESRRLQSGKVAQRQAKSMTASKRHGAGRWKYLMRNSSD
jgi:hypothetical protein